MNKLYIIGIGPGALENMTLKAKEALCGSEVVVGYTVYIEQIKELISHQEIFVSGMRQEKERCQKAIDFCKEGKKVSVVCSGDPSLYGMAGLIYELLEKEQLLKDIKVEVISGVSAAFSSGALLGAPIVEDFCTISLSDYMVSYEKILKRVEHATKADFVIALYNPRSKKRPHYLEEVVQIVLQTRAPKTPVGIVKSAYRQEEEIIKTTLDKVSYDQIDMFSTVIIGNSNTRWVGEHMVTARGYTL
jgi:precorrin-3B C17-methyltransferase